jgi:MFS family permease
MDRLRKYAEFFGLKRSVIGLLGVVILVGMGERMGERFLPIYLMALGGGELAVGILSGLVNLLGALYSYPGGYLSDRIGTRRSLLVFNLMSVAGYLIVIVVPAWYAVITGALFFLAWSAISLPATMSVVAKVLPQSKRTMGVSMIALVRRIPMAAGPLAGGAFINAFGVTTGIRLAFATAVAMAFIAMILQQRLLEEDAPRESTVDKSGEKGPLISKDLKQLLISDILVRFCEQIPNAFVVVWCMKTIAAPVDALGFGVLTSVEMATAVLCYIPVAWLADRLGKKPFVVATFLFFTLFPLVLYYSRSFWPLAGAFVIRGLKEFGEPSRKALIMDLAPEGKKAEAFGLYYLVRDLIVSLAAFGGAFLWSRSPELNLGAAALFGLAGTIWFAVFGRDVMAPPKEENGGEPLKV